MLAVEALAPAPAPLHWRPLAAGLLIGGVLVGWVPFAGFILHYLNILVHELGHAAVAWSVGIPAIPKFNLQQGGGITAHGERMTVLVLLLLAAGAWLLALAWSRGRWLRCGAMVVVGLPVLLAVTGLDKSAITAAGHLAEVALACVFLARAATGIAVAHWPEQWLYAICGWAMWWIVMGFSWSLATDPAYLAWYHEATCGTDNDLVKLSDASGLSVVNLAWTLMLVAILAPAGSFWLARQWGGQSVH